MGSKVRGHQSIRQRLHVVVETISGETDALTDMDRGKQFDLPVSRSLEKRDINLRRAIQLQEPTPVTLQDLVPLCVIQQPFPSFEGEKRVTDTSELAKEWSAMLADWKAVGPEWNVSRISMPGKPLGGIRFLPLRRGTPT